MSLVYGVIGTGAIGGYYGGLLAKGGNEVHFLCHTDYEYVKLNGLQVDSCDGNFCINPINAYRTTADMPKCDVVLVCLKTTNNYLLKEMLASIIHKDTIVILIQNGIGVEEDLQKLFPNLHIAAGLAFICSGKIGPGHIHHQYYGRLTIAPYSCDDLSLLALIIADFIKSGVEALTADYTTARWKKAVWNIPFNGMTVALNTTTDKLMSHPEIEQQIKNMMLEVIHAANWVNHARLIEDDFADAMIASTKKMVPYSPSMKLDYDHHRPMEIYYIYQKPFIEAARAGYDMKRVKFLCDQLLFISTARKKKK